MTVNEAFDALKLELQASEKEIQRSFRTLSKKAHPDKSRVRETAEQVRLNEARDVALAYVKVRHALVPLEVANSAISVWEKKVMQQGYKEDAEAFVRKLESRKTVRIRQLRNFVWLTAAVLGGVVFFGKEIFPLFPLAEDVQMTLKLGTVAFAGLSVLYMQLIQDRLKKGIEALEEDYQDPEECARSLARALGFKKVSSFDFNRIRDSDGQKHHDDLRLALTGGISHRDRMKVLLLKAKENGLIEPVKKTEMKPNRLNLYDLKFDPSDFDEGAPLDSPSRVLTPIEAAKEGIAAGASITVTFGIVSALVTYFFSIYWALIPEFFVLMGLFLFVVELVRYLRLRKASLTAE